VPEALTLFVFTMLLLFLPKVISFLHTSGNASLAKEFGGKGRLALSVVLETITSTYSLPSTCCSMRSRAVILLGQGVSWVTQRRARTTMASIGDRRLSPTADRRRSDSWGHFVVHPLAEFFWWLSPVIAGLVLSIPLSIFISKASLGRRARSSDCF